MSRKKIEGGSQKRKRRRNKVFFVATEGNVTEPGYFRHLESLLNRNSVEISISMVTSRHKSDPVQVLKRMNKHLKERVLSESDEAWLVVDKNGRSKDRFSALFDWENSNYKYNVALSNPCFEFWLLLHFKNCKRNQEGKYYTKTLKQYDPNYVKQINERLYSLERIQNAVSRALKDQGVKKSKCMEDLGCTTVCKLVEKILNG